MINRSAWGLSYGLAAGLVVALVLVVTATSDVPIEIAARWVIGVTGIVALFAVAALLMGSTRCYMGHQDPLVTLVVPMFTIGLLSATVAAAINALTTH